MVKLKTKWFNRWARKQSITNTILLDTIDALVENLNTVSLGGGLYKVRTLKKGQGKRGGYRTLIVYKKKELAVFVYGFSKTDKSNLDKEELRYFKKLASDLMNISTTEYERQVKIGNFFPLEGNL